MHVVFSLEVRMRRLLKSFSHISYPQPAIHLIQELTCWYVYFRVVKSSNEADATKRNYTRTTLTVDFQLHLLFKFLLYNLISGLKKLCDVNKIILLVGILFEKYFFLLLLYLNFHKSWLIFSEKIFSTTLWFSIIKEKY